MHHSLRMDSYSRSSPSDRRTSPTDRRCASTRRPYRGGRSRPPPSRAHRWWLHCCLGRHPSQGWRDRWRFSTSSFRIPCDLRGNHVRHSSYIDAGQRRRLHTSPRTPAPRSWISRVVGPRPETNACTDTSISFAFEAATLSTAPEADCGWDAEIERGHL